MSLLSQRRRRPALVVLGICLIYAGGPVSLRATNEFQLFTRPLAISERGTVSSYVLQTSHGRFSFLPPPNWVVKEDATAKEVVMMAQTLTTSIRFKIVEAKPQVSTMPARVAQWRTEILENYPGAKITGEFPCYTSRIEGAAFDLERSAPNKKKIFTRLAFIPLPEGRVEGNLTSTGGKLEDAHIVFGNFLTSFRVEPTTTR